MDFGFCVGEWGRMVVLCVCPGTNHSWILRDVHIFLAASATSRLSLKIISKRMGFGSYFLFNLGHIVLSAV